MGKPLFSILHTSARPDKWRAVYDDWMSKAVHPEDVEYVLCIDPRWGFSVNPYDYVPGGGLDNLLVTQNTGRRCYVDGVNIAARASSGRILIVNADDQFPCDNWDVRICDVVRSECGGWAQEFLSGVEGIDAKFVIEVSTGTPSEHDRGILVMPILSRQRYEDQGSEVFYHEYESMFADNDFCEHARRDGVVIDARHLMFPHRHAAFDAYGWVTPEMRLDSWDEAYEVHNRPEAYHLGGPVLDRRRAAKFATAPARRTIALCLSGERFEGVWVDALLSLYGHLIDLGFNVLKLRGCSTNVYQMREEIRRAALDYSPRPELCLWMDDDNPVWPDKFDRLLQGLDAHPEVDGVSGWCWIHNEKKGGFMPSCGEWAPDHLHWNPFHPRLVNETELKPFDVGGLPCMLMRISALEKAGHDAFLPILNSQFEHGMAGEDMSFFSRAELGGAKFLVDPQCRVPHLKYVEVEPILPEEGAGPPVKVAVMMRVKNEGRWLKRVIDSVRPLCGKNLFIMEDGSTDDTVAVIQQAMAEDGGYWFTSPFAGQGLNEQRDKNWLLGEVKKLCSPDWVLMPDGDEELEPGGCDKIRRALESHPPVDGFSLRVLNLWNSVDTVRFDGVYGKMARQSLFRANSNLEFEPCYPGGNENHVVLHVSNAPGLGGPRLAPLNVFLLHYGYLHREDRVRKFDWITKLDPGNEAEGGYLHMIQGDGDRGRLGMAVPADIKLKHAGPLLLQKLPARMVPKWDDVPGPFAKGLTVYSGTSAHPGTQVAEHPADCSCAICRRPDSRPLEAAYVPGSIEDIWQKKRTEPLSSAMSVYHLAEHTQILELPLPVKPESTGSRCIYCQPGNPPSEPGAHHAADCPLYRSPFVGPDAAYWDGKLRERFKKAESKPNGHAKLNLGCCDRRLDGYTGVDRVPGPAVDVVADLSKPWPWADESVAEILAHDVIEHLPDKIRTMNEAWRVLKPGGRAEIVVPTTDGPGAFQDPTHVSFWNRNSFHYFEARNLYRERFANSYGILARFKVVGEGETITRDGPKLKIVLEKVS
jgi:hypothetical protein